MAHVGEEFRFQLVGPAKMISLFIQLRVQRHHAAIGILQLPVERGSARLAGPESPPTPGVIPGSGAAVPERRPVALARQRIRRRCAADVGLPNQRARAWAAVFSARWSCRAPGVGFDLKLIHQTARAGDSQAHAGLRLISAIQNAVQIPNAWSGVGHFDEKQLRRNAAFNRDTPPAPAGIIERVAGNLGDGGGNTRLILAIEAQQTGDLPGALPGGHSIVFGTDADRKNANSSSTAPSRRPPSRRHALFQNLCITHPRSGRGRAAASPG